MPIEERRKELSRQMLYEANGLELVMKRYQELNGYFPRAEMSPRQIIDAIVEREAQLAPAATHSSENSVG